MCRTNTPGDKGMHVGSIMASQSLVLMSLCMRVCLLRMAVLQRVTVVVLPT